MFLSAQRFSATFFSIHHKLNAAALTKPFAMEHLTADLIGNHSEAVVITETNFKNKRTDYITCQRGSTRQCCKAICISKAKHRF
jgi:hypothetical protein